jgi:hypothetical protein
VVCSEVYNYHHDSTGRAVDACKPDMCCMACGTVYHAACLMRMIGTTENLLVKRRCVICAHEFILVDDETKDTSPFRDDRLIDNTVEVDSDGFPLINPTERATELERREREAAARIVEAGPEPQLEPASNFQAFSFPPAPSQLSPPPSPPRLQRALPQALPLPLPLPQALMYQPTSPEFSPTSPAYSPPPHLLTIDLTADNADDTGNAGNANAGNAGNADDASSDDNGVTTDAGSEYVPSASDGDDDDA